MLLLQTLGKEGMVLLENRTKPCLSIPAKMCRIGNIDIISGEQEAGMNEAYTVSLIEGIENAGPTPDRELMGIYKSYRRCQENKADQLIG